MKKSSTGELSTLLFEKKKIDCQAYLHKKIRTPGVFKTQYSICLTPTFKAKKKYIYIDRGYKKTEIYDSISKKFDKNREDTLTQNNEPKYRIPLTLPTYFTKCDRSSKETLEYKNVKLEFKNIFPASNYVLP